MDKSHFKTVDPPGFYNLTILQYPPSYLKDYDTCRFGTYLNNKCSPQWRFEPLERALTTRQGFLKLFHLCIPKFKLISFFPSLSLSLFLSFFSLSVPLCISLCLALSFSPRFKICFTLIASFSSNFGNRY